MILKDTLEIAYEISKLVKFSPKQEAKLEPVKEEICDTSSGFSKFSATRWLSELTLLILF